MSLQHQITRRRMKRRGPLGTVCGLLVACAVTLIGLAVGLEPHVILWRSFISAILIGSLVSFGMSVIYVANSSRP
jgi:hypothetical protein